jgi:hypothetical protein
MTDINKHIEKLIKMLQSPKANTRYEACEYLRVAPAITPEAIRTLETAVYDQEMSVAEAAKRALAVQLAPEPAYEAPSQLILPKEGEFDFGFASLLSGLLALLFLLLNFVSVFSSYNWFLDASCLLSPSGIVLGVLGLLLQKNRKKTPAIIGLVLSIGISLFYISLPLFGQ